MKELKNERYMKRIFVILAAIMTLGAMQAQVLEENESALVYYSPKTSVSLDFTYTVETQVRGQFAEYAESMLDIHDAVKENSTSYEIKDVRIGTSTSTDYTRPHKVKTEAGFPVLLTINDRGLLTGYNVPLPEKKAPFKSHEHDRKASQAKAMKMQAPPYPEEVLKAATPEAQAFEVAKQIFHLRETRMYLINGEVEHAPADGKAMELVLDELNRQEQALIQLFVGEKKTRRAHKTVRIEPTNEGQLLFFSDENGFTDGDNIDADTIEVRMVCEQQTRKAAVVEEKKGKKKGENELTQIMYNIPGNCMVSVLYKGHSLADRTVPIAQLGIDVALPKSMFTGAELPKIIFSDKTGNIVSISK